MTEELPLCCSCLLVMSMQYLVLLAVNLYRLEHRLLPSNYHLLNIYNGIEDLIKKILMKITKTIFHYLKCVAFANNAVFALIL